MRLSTPQLTKHLDLKLCSEHTCFHLTIQLLPSPDETQLQAIKLLRRVCCPTLVGVKRLKPQLLNTYVQPVFTDLYAQFGCPSEDAPEVQFQGAVRTAASGVYCISGASEFVVAFAELPLRDLVQCGTVAAGMEELQRLGQLDGKNEACEVVQVE
ncbi:hypothetical protein SS50377_28228 [Spironucleus salmonicida]|uniref:Uncharacterized protein n=1 Tax=Spironucleus salmonicida TaxID=348837 RepID=V6LV04_9EUKA|nr:hypothetical protein SS50377_28217 [Spironucleus salmonicida]KAH0570253.1 hypothetical protein SS50377_28228 [Spironucleus salmonicida]|eukprot:EST48410.1 Hypothetical protein SS50377_11358 [Spironucleus salmonicida]